MKRRRSASTSLSTLCGELPQLSDGRDRAGGLLRFDKGAWIPSENGRIIRILNVNNGIAEVDVSGNGQAADAQALADLGIYRR